MQWELVIQEWGSIPGKTERYRSVGKCVRRKQPLQKTTYRSGSLSSHSASWSDCKWALFSIFIFFGFLSRLRWCRQPCQRLRTQRRCQSQSRPSWLQTFPMSWLSCWRRLCLITLSSVSTGTSGLQLARDHNNLATVVAIFLNSPSVLAVFPETSRTCSFWRPSRQTVLAWWSTLTG